jgi:hypothetical protein
MHDVRRVLGSETDEQLRGQLCVILEEVDDLKIIEGRGVIPTR